MPAPFVEAGGALTRCRSRTSFGMSSKMFQFPHTTQVVVEWAMRCLGQLPVHVVLTLHVD